MKLSETSDVSKVIEFMKSNGDKISYIKFFNQGNEVESRNLRGYLPSKILSYMVNLSFCQKPIFFSRHGQSKFNEMNRIGGDSDLSVIGVNYSEKLKDFIVEYLNKGNLLIKIS